MKKEKITVIDIGGQYAHLISSRIRRLGFYTEIVPSNINSKELKNSAGIIISGGGDSASDGSAPDVNNEIFDLDIPILGICLGHQLIAGKLGGKVKKAKVSEFGEALLFEKKQSKLFKNVFSKKDKKTTVWMSHGDEVITTPKDFKILAFTKDCKIAAMENKDKNIYSIQFHPEVTHSVKGKKILENFVQNICSINKNWDIDKYFEEEKEILLKQVGIKNVFHLVSGGVDSTVSFYFLSKILGPERVFGLFVDTGLLKLNEGEHFRKSLSKLKNANFEILDAKKEFISALEDIYDPEKKRRIIGQKFLEVQKKFVKKLKLDPSKWLLGQGTIYPDTIESGGTKNAKIIKTHHNRVPEIEELIKKGLVVEPLKNLYKDEVRELGRKIGVAKEIISRHPFPGPGLGVRILCAKEKSLPENYSKLKKQIEKYLELPEENTEILPIRSVGVQGDDRTYAHALCIFGKFSNQRKKEITTHITNKFREINRVLFCISRDKKPGKVLVISGPCGTGKTTLAKLIEKNLRFKRISGDEVRKDLFPDFEGKIWKKEHFKKLKKIHSEIIKRSKIHLKKNENVVIDYIIDKRFFDQYKDKLEENLEIRILFPKREKAISRDKQRNNIHVGEARILELFESFENFKKEIGDENFIDNSNFKAEEIFKKYFSYVENSFSLRKGFIEENRIKIIQKCDQIVDTITRKNNLYDSIWQFPVVLIPVSLSEKNQESIVLRPFQSEDVMSASAFFLTKKIEKEISNQLLDLPQISDVYFDATSKPPGTIEWE